VIGGNTDLGVLFMLGLQSTGYGFRKDPYADKQNVRLAYATKAGSVGVDYTGEFRRENSPLILGLYTRLSGLDFLHFYGFGNESKNDQVEDFYKLKHSEYVLRPSVSRYVGKHGKIMAEIPVKYSETDLQPDRLITAVAPYGTEDFFQAGAGLGAEVDTRSSSAATSGGVRAEVHGNVYPELGAVKSTFGEVHGEVALYQPVHILSTPTFALRGGGRQVWGTYPYHEAAYIGGARTVRGFAQQRFAGDAALFGNAELRIPIAHTYILVPGNLGIFGMFDTGRVFLDGESSTTWHNAAGGGLWMSFIDPANTMSLSVANSEEDTRVYVHLSMSF
jgi:outer membrane protein assembly factor BamA